MIDLKKDPIYKAKSDPAIVKVPKNLFVMVDGQGAPDNSEQGNKQFQRAMEIIFGIVYTIKFWDKTHTPPVGYDKFTMPPIEALWWTESGKTLDLNKPADWRWTAMLRLPEFVTARFFEQVVREISERKKSDIYRLARLETFAEGLSAQIMHIGPYDAETPNINKLHDFIRANDYEPTGKHHELYFSDPRRTQPENLRTIIRQPIRRKS